MPYTFNIISSLSIHLSRSFLSGFDVRFQDLVSTWLLLMIIIVLVTFIVSEITRNYGQVDKLWSLLPVAYGGITAATSPSPRIFVMVALVTIWGLRLSYNFSIKGGYNIVPWKGNEDYRWAVLRGNPVLKGRFRFTIFNLLFISLYQNIVILLFSSPFLLAALFPEAHINYIDIMASILMLSFIFTEAVADNQLFRFHQEKKNEAKGKKRYSRSIEKGFMTEGLWKYVRHPNFTSEQAIWLFFYFFGVAASGKLINLTLLGSGLLILIFMGSSRLTESISSSKYPEYKSYQKEVPRYLPSFKAQ
jgi:steroid 5-alpha reductase family enzyme